VRVGAGRVLRHQMMRQFTANCRPPAGRAPREMAWSGMLRYLGGGVALWSDSSSLVTLPTAREPDRTGYVNSQIRWWWVAWGVGDLGVDIPRPARLASPRQGDEGGRLLRPPVSLRRVGREKVGGGSRPCRRNRRIGHFECHFMLVACLVGCRALGWFPAPASSWVESRTAWPPP
jgi:hypothetical protein